MAGYPGYPGYPGYGFLQQGYGGYPQQQGYGGYPQQQGFAGYPPAGGYPQQQGFAGYPPAGGFPLPGGAPGYPQAYPQPTQPEAYPQQVAVPAAGQDGKSGDVSVSPGAVLPGAGAFPPGAFPPGAFPPGAFPPGAGTFPPGAGAFPPGAFPPGAGALPSGAFPPVYAQPGFPTPPAATTTPSSSSPDTAAPGTLNFPMLFKASCVKEGNPVTTFLGEWSFYEAKNPTAFGFAGAREYYNEIQFFDQNTLMTTLTWASPDTHRVIGFDILESTNKIVTYLGPKDSGKGHAEVLRVYDMYGSGVPNELISGLQNNDIRAQVMAFPTHSTPCVMLTDKNSDNVCQFYDLNSGRPFRSYKNPSRHNDWMLCNAERDPHNHEAFWMNLYQRIVQFDLRCPDDRASITLPGMGSDVCGIRSYGISCSEHYVAAAARYLPTTVYDRRNPGTPLYQFEDRCYSVTVHGNALAINFDERVNIFDLARAIDTAKPEKVITNARRSFGAFLIRNGRRLISVPSLDVIALDGPTPK